MTALDPVACGIDFEHRWNPPPEFADRLNSYAVGVGVAIGDLDDDGLPDVVLACQETGGRLYRNAGGWRFVDVTQSAQLDLDGLWTTGVTLADVDNDGRLDLYFCAFGQPNRLYLNQGDGTFRECAREYGVDFRGASVVAAFADYDNDGWLDMYLATNHFPLLEQVNIPLRRDAAGRPQVAQEWEQYRYIQNPPRNVAAPRIVEGAQYDYLFRNTGKGRFEDVTEAAGIGRHNDHGLSATWWDYNHDGRPDLYVANDFYGPDRCYCNQGDGTFVDVLASQFPYTPWFSMGSDAADVNNDGRVDLFVADMSATNHYREMVTMGDLSDDAWFLDYATPRQYMRNMLFVNSGAAGFAEAAYFAGLQSSDWTWSVKFGDLDADGRVDLYVTNGMTRDYQNADLKQASLDAQAAGKAPNPHEFWVRQKALAEANRAFRNQGDLRFEDVSAAWGLDLVGVSLGAAFGDLDGDGDLDLVVNNFQDRPALYRNDVAHGQAQIQVQLRGERGNRFGLGAEVRVVAGDLRQVRQLFPARGYLSCDEPLAHFGLGARQRVDRLELRWPSGARQTFRDLPANHRYTFAEPAFAKPAEIASADSAPAAAPLFLPTDAAAAIVHWESDFDDLAAQPGLPHRIAQRGPTVAVGDVDQDGQAELFVGGAAGQAATLYRLEQGAFRAMPSEAWVADAAAEDTGAALLDADGDGDLDLVVASGSVEHPDESPWYVDRLYLNDGQGNFTRIDPQAFSTAAYSSACLASADYDRDGDVDVFIGGGAAPGAYPQAHPSRLLNNDTRSKTPAWTDVTAEHAPALSDAGIVRAASWIDVDRDGWLDLALVEEWGPIRLLHNRGGRLEEATSTWGLAELKGWWQSVTVGDFDGDGRPDLLVGNLGTNTRLQATAEQPAQLLRHDFVPGAARQLLQARFDAEGRRVPVLGRAALVQQFPALAERFPTADAYARADLAALFGDAALAAAERRELTELRTGILWNRGQRFEFAPLPPFAQLAPVMCVVTLDVNDDGLDDAFLAQNFWGARSPQTRLGGGTGVVLLGDGQQRCVLLEPVASGIALSEPMAAAISVDINGDAQGDLLVFVNDGQARTWVRSSPTAAAAPAH